ncbi:glycohydrolase toxin TNT-related protein [Amycolatopsis sp. K13G38]|uniref:Glycohydrolase toxin TNT-related protein n=1 Tax=Amycolatopsis acididurans TaxID=2724524 RepID=A0ABX1JDW1_9PSEU|nr:glycohydrolase toxin TNT-related protein [Amycolatopsis acididurans]
MGNPADPRGNPANARGNPADPDGDPSITDPRGGQAADARGDYAAAAAGPHGDFGRGGYDTGEQAADQPRPPVEQPTTFTPAVDPSAGAPTQVQPAIKDEPEAPFAANPSSTRLVPPASPRLAPQPAPEHPEPAVNTLRTRLRDLGIPESAYRIGEPAEHGWSMEQVDAGWRVGWYDDKLTNPAVFGDPEDAAAFMLGKLLLDPRGREASPSSISVPIPNAISVTGGERPDAAPVNGGRRSRVEEPDPVHQAPESVAERLEEPALGAPPTMLSPPVAPPPARREPQRREPARPAASSAQNGSSQWPIQPLPGEPPLTLFRGKEMRELPPGSELDRFGAPNGNLTYVAGTPFEERSLVPEWVSRPYHVYRVQRPLEALAGVAIPWFNQPGGGSAYLLPASIEELVAEGDLIELDPGEPPID